MNVELKNNKFNAIQVSGDPNQFGELKDFCDDKIKITYERAPGIGDYWSIKAYDDFKDDWVVVPDGDYIIKNEEGYQAIINHFNYKIYFNEISE